MKSYLLFYRDGEPWLKQKNPLISERHLVSESEYNIFEKLYEDSALLLLDPELNKTEYFESELKVVWRHKGIEISSEPNFISTMPEEYDQVFKPVNQPRFQEKVRRWLFECFDEEVANDKAERVFRFMEESLELAQSLGMSKDDVLRCVVYTFGRTEGEPAQEVGGVMVTLAALCYANGLDMNECAEAEIHSNFKRIQEIHEKWINKIAISPNESLN